MRSLSLISYLFLAKWCRWIGRYAPHRVPFRDCAVTFWCSLSPGSQRRVAYHRGSHGIGRLDCAIGDRSAVSSAFGARSFCPALIPGDCDVSPSLQLNKYIIKPREIDMAKGEQKGNREAKKPKKEKIKTIAAAPSQKTAGWQPSFATGKKK